MCGKPASGLASRNSPPASRPTACCRILQVREAGPERSEVVAGRRRLAALKMLAQQKALAKDAPISCNMLDAERDTEISLAENEMRQAMHSADQFDAFKALADQGMGVADIAARFGVSALIVKQRLKLASVSPVLMVLYREDGPTLDQLMAFTVGDDHATHERAWIEAAPFDRHPTAAASSVQTLTGMAAA